MVKVYLELCVSKLIQFTLLITLFFSCAVERPSGKTEAEVLYKEAKDLMADRRFILATEKLNTLRSQYPYSYYSTYAELALADILFHQENFEEAAASYILFRDFHPKYKEQDYVLFKIAESYFSQKPQTYDRDLTPAVKAIKYFNELKSLYPNSKYLKDAKSKIEECRKMLVDKEKYIADFYYRTEDYESAKHRYNNMFENFRSYEMKSLAALRLLSIAVETKNTDLCKEVSSMSKGLLKGKEMSQAETLSSKCM